MHSWVCHTVCASAHTVLAVHHSVQLSKTASCLLQVLATARDVDAVWKELADVQQRALNAALAAKAKRKPKQASQAQNALPEQHATATSQAQNGIQGASELAAQDAVTTDAEGSLPDVHPDSNGHLASEENLAANAQAPVPTAPHASIQKSQVCLSAASIQH